MLAVVFGILGYSMHLAHSERSARFRTSSLMPAMASVLDGNTAAPAPKDLSPALQRWVGVNK
jgi:hypothetical protein